MAFGNNADWANSTMKLSNWTRDPTSGMEGGAAGPAGPSCLVSKISTSSWIAHPRLLRFESHLAIDYESWCLFVLKTLSDSGEDTYNAHDKRQNIYGFVVRKEVVWSVVIVIICFIMLLPLWWAICHCNEIESGWWSLSAVLYNLLHSNIDKPLIIIHGLLDMKKLKNAGT